jgi:two-component system NtrC family sensor kinase
MKLAAKLVSVLLGVIILILLADGYMLTNDAADLFESDMKHDARLLGAAVGGLMSDVWRTGGQERTLELLEDVNRAEREMDIRWVWLDADADESQRAHVPLDRLEPVVRGQRVSVELSGDGGGSLYTYIPLAVDSDRVAALELSRSLKSRDRYVRSAGIRTITLAVLIVVISGVLVLSLGVTWVGRPLQQLIEKTRRIGAGDLANPLHLNGHDELTELASAINTMCDQLAATRDRLHEETEGRLKALEQLRHADRLRTVGTLASGIAHELGTPLNVVSGRAGIILAGGDLSASEIEENADIIKKQAERMTKIIRQLLDFARRRPREIERLDLRDVVGQSIDLLASFARKQGVRLRAVLDDDPSMTKADAAQIQQVLTNLIVNAVQAMPKQGEVLVTCRRDSARPPEGIVGDEGEYICVDVEDQGEGVSEENVDHLFDPFFTTKDVGEGTGLGLSIAYSIVREHGGWIDVRSERGKGSCFSVYLPMEQDA